MLNLNLTAGNFLQVVDSSFSHSRSMVSGTEPLHFSWSRSLISHDHIFLTNSEILASKNYREQGFRKIIGVFYESPAILLKEYRDLFKKELDLDLILTSNYRMLSLPNSKWVPGGGIWNFEDKINFNNKILFKSKNISFLCSGKNVAKMHRIRREAFDNLIFNSAVDVFGPPLCNNVDLDEYLNPYHFSIIYENFVDENYFTEKILNCFANAVIPIYNGARNIGEYFDIEGIISFSSNKELYGIINDISTNYYYSRLKSIKINFDIAREKFRCIEDYMINESLITIT